MSIIVLGPQWHELECHLSPMTTPLTISIMVLGPEWYQLEFHLSPRTTQHAVAHALYPSCTLDHIGTNWNDFSVLGPHRTIYQSGS